MNISLRRLAKNVTHTARPVEPTQDAKERSALAQSFVLQPFWSELLWAIEEQRKTKAHALKQPGQNWDEDARKLAEYRAWEEACEFVVNYPARVAESGGTQE